MSAVLAALLVIAGVSAATPVTDGFRDQAYSGGGAAHPTADKSQSKLWYTDGSWFAGMFDTASAKYDINRLNPTTNDWVDTGTVIDERDQSNGDYLWDEGSQKLWVASAHDGNSGTNDSTKVYKFTYTAPNTYTLAAGFPATIPDTVGGVKTTTITRDSTGRLWAVWPSGTEVRYSVSTDEGSVWSTPVQVPAQVGNSIKANTPVVVGDTASVIAFGAEIGVAWSDHDLVPTAGDGGFYFATINAVDDPTVAVNWTLTKLPTLVPGTNPPEAADNHINLKTTSDGRVFMVGKTGKDTANCATNQSSPLVEFFQRTAAGVWSVSLVGTVGDCNTRPQVVISEQLDTAFVFATAPNGGGAVYLKSAPLSGSEAFKFRAAAGTPVERGAPFIRSATETLINDPTTTKQVVTAASGIVVLANDVNASTDTGLKHYLHNKLPIAVSDGAGPVGSVAIAAGAALTAQTLVNVDVPATDAGSGVGLVRLSNSSTMTGAVLTTGQTFAYRTPIAWTLAAGQGSQRVYAQWRDGAGNWSPVLDDDIVVDTVAPTVGSVQIDGGAATASLSVTLILSASDGAGSGVTQVIVSNTSDFALQTTIAYAASVPWTLPAVDGPKDVYVKFVDAVGNTSTAVTDSIDLDQTPPSAGTISIAGGAVVTGTTAVTVTAAGAGGDATQVRASDQSGMAGALAVSNSGSFAWDLPVGGDGQRTVYVQWADALGNWSAIASDAIILDMVAPTGSLAINGDVVSTSSTAATLTFLNASADVTSVRVGAGADLSGVAYQAYTPGMSLPWTLSAGDGQKAVYVQFKDVADRESTVVSDSIALDQTPPTVGTVSINGGAGVAIVTAATVTIAGAGGDATQARASNQSDMSSALAVAASGSFAWTLVAGGDGQRTVYVQWADALGNWSTPTSDAIRLDSVVPAGSLAINGGAAWTNSTAATLNFSDTSANVTLVRVGAGPDLSSVAYQAYTAGMSLPWTLSAGDGQKTVYVQFQNASGRESAVVSDAIGLDQTAPRAGGIPAHGLGGVVTTGIATRLTWAAGSDASSGVAAYVVQQSVNGGRFVTVATTAVGSAVLQLASGRTYKFRIGSRDQAGNVSAFKSSATFKALSVGESSAVVKYTGRWSVVKFTKYMGGAARTTSVNGATATLTFTGNRVAWLSTKARTQGTARAYVNGRLVANVNLASTTTKYKQIVFTKAWSSVAKRTLKIVVTGTAGRRVTIDQFFVLR